MNDADEELRAAAAASSRYKGGAGTAKATVRTDRDDHVSRAEGVVGQRHPLTDERFRTLPVYGAVVYQGVTRSHGNRDQTDVSGFLK